MREVRLAVVVLRFVGLHVQLTSGLVRYVQILGGFVVEIIVFLAILVAMLELNVALMVVDLV